MKLLFFLISYLFYFSLLNSDGAIFVQRDVYICSFFQSDLCIGLNTVKIPPAVTREFTHMKYRQNFVTWTEINKGVFQLKNYNTTFLSVIGGSLKSGSIFTRLYETKTYTGVSKLTTVDNVHCLTVTSCENTLKCKKNEKWNTTNPVEIKRGSYVKLHTCSNKFDTYQGFLIISIPPTAQPSQAPSIFSSTSPTTITLSPSTKMSTNLVLIDPEVLNQIKQKLEDISSGFHNVSQLIDLHASDIKAAYNMIISILICVYLMFGTMVFMFIILERNTNREKVVPNNLVSRQILAHELHLSNERLTAEFVILLRALSDSMPSTRVRFDDNIRLSHLSPRNNAFVLSNVQRKESTSSSTSPLNPQQVTVPVEIHISEERL